MWIQSIPSLFMRRPVRIKSRPLRGGTCPNCPLCLPLQERALILAWQAWLGATGLRINSPSWWPSSKPPRCTCEASAPRQVGGNSGIPTAPKGRRARRRSEWPTLQVRKKVCAVYMQSLCVEPPPPAPSLIWFTLRKIHRYWIHQQQNATGFVVILSETKHETRSQCFCFRGFTERAVFMWSAETLDRNAWASNIPLLSLFIYTRLQSGRSQVSLRGGEAVQAFMAEHICSVLWGKRGHNTCC